jgi:hypothetical protein
MDSILINVSIKSLTIVIIYLISAGFSLSFYIQYLHGVEEKKYPSPTWKKITLYATCITPVFNIIMMLIGLPLVHLFHENE